MSRKLPASPMATTMHPPVGISNFGLNGPGAADLAAWEQQSRLSGVDFLRSLTAMILTAGWGCTVTCGRLFVLAQDRTLDAERQSTVRSALWLTLVSHPRAVLEYAAADVSGLSRATLKLAVAENHAQSGLPLKFLEKIADPAQPSPIQAIAAEVLTPTKISDRRFVVVAA